MTTSSSSLFHLPLVQGRIPTELGDSLSRLEYLGLALNHLTGPIPSSLRALQVRRKGSPLPLLLLFSFFFSFFCLTLIIIIIFFPFSYPKIYPKLSEMFCNCSATQKFSASREHVEWRLAGVLPAPLLASISGCLPSPAPFFPSLLYLFLLFLEPLSKVDSTTQLKWVPIVAKVLWQNRLSGVADNIDLDKMGALRLVNLTNNEVAA